MSKDIFILPLGGGGEELEELSLNITENGTYTATEGTAYTNVTVNVPDIPAVTEPLNVTENGTYTVPQGVDGYNEVYVDVPTTEIENLTITQNGTYSAPEGVSYGNVEVNVPAVDVSVVSSVFRAAPVSFTALDVVIRIGSNKTMTSYGVDYSIDNFQTYQSVSNSGTYFGEKTITVTGLSSGTTYQVRSFVVVDDVRYDQEPFNTIMTASIPVYTESVPAKATMMTTTNLSSGEIVTMGYGSTAMPDENFYVDWGDGSDVQLYAANTSAEVKHTYSETGKKTIYCWSDSTTDTEYGKMPPFKGYDGTSYKAWARIETIDTPLQKIYGGSTQYTANNTPRSLMFGNAAELKFVCSDLFENYCDPTQPLASNCYYKMFKGCTGLTVAPELPATTLTDNCYKEMFYGCTRLTTAPELPATELANDCYYRMFYGCTSLTTAPELPATTLANDCYNGMFQGCTGLTTAPELPATTLADWCYYEMFSGCTALTTAPELPATRLAGYCYYYMFYGCTSLTTAPVLPATTLADNCYYYMFYGCTALTTAPELPATRLVNNCYYSMFYGCTNLQSVTTYVTTWNTSNAFNWLQSAGRNATNPTVYCPADSTIPSGSVSGIPTGWTRADIPDVTD